MASGLQCDSSMLAEIPRCGDGEELRRCGSGRRDARGGDACWGRRRAGLGTRRVSAGTRCRHRGLSLRLSAVTLAACTSTASRVLVHRDSFLWLRSVTDLHTIYVLVLFYPGTAVCSAECPEAALLIKLYSKHSLLLKRRGRNTFLACHVRGDQRRK
ncbi:hypothetical protein FB567DRAFT_186012 [Paraphoma chrysanthemicola]|uniref:Uncharacterized protein n=1 Tax=Paraphoma chrysanthemicola TaxID=798071 RepID=A0A8K0QWV7_9PLEO|nr:hypothetical protein FB567DRAFT_186012 [Paraphoma chrysanthemicola]